MENPVFDRAHLAQYTDGDAALEAELFGLLTDQAKRCVDALRTAVDEEAWKAAAHTLKGAASGMGAFALADACGRAEETAQANWPAAALSVEQASDEALKTIRETLSI